jgi:hypothetical protein
MIRIFTMPTHLHGLASGEAEAVRPQAEPGRGKAPISPQDIGEYSDLANIEKINVYRVRQFAGIICTGELANWKERTINDAR